MNTYLEIGYFANSALKTLEQSLIEIYIPLLSNTSMTGVNDADSLLLNSRFAGLKSDLVTTIHKFHSQLISVSTQISGKSRLKIPDDLVELDKITIESAVADVSMIDKLEKLGDEWILIVETTLAKETSKVPVGNVHFLLSLGSVGRN